MSSEKFCLKWNDFESNLSNAFRDLKAENDFFDVTLACDDNQIQAHKLILSACSPFFRTVLRRNPHQHPLLYLRGIKFRDIESILQFMYHGEVNVAQEDLNTFLSVSEELRIKGLTQGQEEKSKPVRSPPNLPSVSRQPPTSRATARTERTPASRQYQAEEEEIEEIIPIKSEPASSQEALIPTESNAVDNIGEYEETYEEYAQYDDSSYTVDATQGNKVAASSIEELDFQISAMMRKCQGSGGSSWECTVCRQSSRYTSDIKRHIEAKHILFPGFSCSRCQKFCKTRKAFSTHACPGAGV